MVRIDRLDGLTASDAELRTWHAALTRLRRYWTPLGVDEPYELFERAARIPDPVEPEFLFGCRDGTGFAGAMAAWWYGDPNNEHRIDTWIDADDADVVRALLAEAVRFARENGRTTIGVEALDGGVVSSVAEELGVKLGLVEHLNVVALAEVDQTRLKTYVTECAAGAPAYELLVFDGAVPDEFVDAFLTVKHSMNDAPRGDLDYNDFAMGPEQLRAHEETHRLRGVARWTLCVRERATGQLAGNTELFIPAVPGAVAEQNDTVVVPAHRGHRLGLWLKAANLLRLAEERPDIAGVSTWNAEQNSHMLAVNHAIGFHCQHRIEERDVKTEALAAALVGIGETPPGLA